IVIPTRIRRGPGLGSKDHVPTVIVEVGDRIHPQLSRFGAAVMEQEQRRVATPARRFPTAGPELVDDALVVIADRGHGEASYQPPARTRAAGSRTSAAIMETALAKLAPRAETGARPT